MQEVRVPWIYGEDAGVDKERDEMTTSQLTRDYWLTMFSEWAEARLMPPQNDEAQAVISEVKQENLKWHKIQRDIEDGVIVLEMPAE